MLVSMYLFLLVALTIYRMIEEDFYEDPGESRHRQWCGTLNNFTEEERQNLIEANTTYKVIGYEHMGEGQGTPHLQMFLCFKHDQTLVAMKKLSGRAHWGMRYKKSTPEKAAAYCKKEPGFYEYGVCPKSKVQQGIDEKTRWTNLLQEARETGRVSDAKVQYYTGKMAKWHHQEWLAEKIAVDNPRDLKHEWYVGPKRCGKSSKAKDENPVHYLKGPHKWWGGYKNEDVVLLEDWDQGSVHLGHYLKIWTDWGKFPAESKGMDDRLIRPKKIIVTSNYRIEEIWTDPNMYEPLQARFNVTEWPGRKKAKIAGTVDTFNA